MSKRTVLFHATLLSLVTAAATARADTIYDFTASDEGAANNFYVEQFFTTPAGPALTNIQVSFLGDPSATTLEAPGTGFLLAGLGTYDGVPTGLNSGVSGFLGQAVGSGGVYSFGSSVTLQPGTLYAFAANAPVSSENVGTKFTDDSLVPAVDGSTVDFATDSNLDQSVDIVITGSVGTIPEPASLGLLAGGAAMLGLLLSRPIRRRG
jgi:hypothetical protein